MCCEPQRLVGSFCLLVPLAWCWLLLPARSIGVGWRSIGPWPVRAAARRRRLLDLELIRELLVPVSTGYTYMTTLNPADITAVQVTYANNIPSARLHGFSVVLSKKEKERGRMKTFSLPSPSLFSSLAVEDLAERPGRGSRPPQSEAASQTPLRPGQSEGATKQRSRRLSCQAIKICSKDSNPLHANGNEVPILHAPRTTAATTTPTLRRDDTKTMDHVSTLERTHCAWLSS